MTDQPPTTVTCRDCTRQVDPNIIGRFIWVCACGWRYGDRTTNEPQT